MSFVPIQNIQSVDRQVRKTENGHTAHDRCLVDLVICPRFGGVGGRTLTHIPKFGNPPQKFLKTP
jgi:hypothetical protein